MEDTLNQTESRKGNVACEVSLRYQEETNWATLRVIVRTQVDGTKITYIKASHVLDFLGVGIPHDKGTRLELDITTLLFGIDVNYDIIEGSAYLPQDQFIKYALMKGWTQDFLNWIVSTSRDFCLISPYSRTKHRFAEHRLRYMDWKNAQRFPFVKGWDFPLFISMWAKHTHAKEAHPNDPASEVSQTQTNTSTGDFVPPAPQNISSNEKVIEIIDIDQMVPEPSKPRIYQPVRVCEDTRNRSRRVKAVFNPPSSVAGVENNARKEDQEAVKQTQKLRMTRTDKIARIHISHGEYVVLDMNIAIKKSSKLAGFYIKTENVLAFFGLQAETMDKVHTLLSDSAIAYYDVDGESYVYEGGFVEFSVSRGWSRIFAEWIIRETKDFCLQHPFRRNAIVIGEHQLSDADFGVISGFYPSHDFNSHSVVLGADHIGNYKQPEGKGATADSSVPNIDINHVGGTQYSAREPGKHPKITIPVILRRSHPYKTSSSSQGNNKDSVDQTTIPDPVIVAENSPPITQATATETDISTTIEGVETQMVEFAGAETQQ